MMRDRRLDEIEQELETLTDNRLNKLFAALFDDVQSANARSALIRHCQRYGITALGAYTLGSLESRLYDMAQRQMVMLKQADDLNKWLTNHLEKLRVKKPRHTKMVP